MENSLTKEKRDNLRFSYRVMVDQAFKAYMEKNFASEKDYAEISRESLNKLRMEIKYGMI